MRKAIDAAKLAEVVIDIEQAREFVGMSVSSEWLVNEVIPFLLSMGSQVDSNLKREIETRAEDLISRWEQRDNAEITGYLSSILDYIIEVIQGYLKELNTS